MSRLFKILGIALGVIVLSLVVLAIALVLIVDPNDYKEDIVQAVKEQTGRELKIEGDLKLSLFPWLGLETGALELANAPGFGKEPFARVAAAGVKVKLLPLLRKELQVNTILIDGLRLELTRNRAGKTNWDDLGPAAGAKTPGDKKQAPSPEGPAAPAVGALTVGGIDVRNGEIRWRDEQHRTQYTLHKLEVKSGQLALDRPLDLMLAFDLESATSPVRTPVKLQTRAQLDRKQKRLDVPKLELSVGELALVASLQATNIETAPLVKGQIEIPPFNARELLKRLGVAYEPTSKDALRQFSLKSEFTANLGNQALNVSTLALAIDDMAMSAVLEGSKVLDAPQWSGNFEIPRFRPDRLLALLMVETPARWRGTFTQGALKASFAADLAAQTVNVTALSLVADGVTVTGTLRARDWQTAPHLNGQFAIPPLNLQPLLAKLGVAVNTVDPKALQRVVVKSNVNVSRQNLILENLEAQLDDTRLSGKLTVNNLAQPAYSFDLKVDEIDLDRYLPAAAPSPPAGQAGGAAAVATGVPATALPMETLRQLQLDGQMAIGKLKAFGMRSSDAQIKLKAQGGILTIGPNQAKLYGGRYEGQTTINARDKVPQYVMKEKLSDIDLRPFLKDAEIYDKLSGKGNLTMDLRARGFDGPDITRTLSGNMAVDVRNGEIEGINLQKSVNQARAQYAQLRGKAVPVLPDARDATVFTRLTGSVVLKNGIATNNDLRMEGANLRATGNGTIDLPAQKIKYRLHVTLAEGASRQGTTVPVDVTGSLAQPTYSVAWNEVLKDQVEKKIEQKKEEKKQELEDRLKEKLRKKYKLF